jgi:hypothetical protein
MKIVFNHIEGWGKVSATDLIHAPCWATPEGETSDDMLEAGWLPWQEQWFPARSVRVDLAQAEFSRTIKKCARKVEVMERRPTAEEMESISHFYMQKKGFRSTHVFEEIYRNQNYKYLIYSHGGEVVGFVAYLLFSRSLVGVQFAWDYMTPQLSLGSVSTYQEILIGRREGCRHYYMMGGYEVVSAYKADVAGFEWWTGQCWSQDRALYLDLCARDSHILLENHDYL